MSYDNQIRDRWTRATLERLGFMGWCQFADLSAKLRNIPREVGGVYVVFRPSLDRPRFLVSSPAGNWRGDPTVSVAELKANWISHAHVLYIGKASAWQLRMRLRAYKSFGSGGSGRHYGGRYIWQLDGIWDCLVAWRITAATEVPRTIESAMIGDFVAEYGKRPFANLAD